MDHHYRGVAHQDFCSNSYSELVATT